jgi:hypothetical protein
MSKLILDANTGKPLHNMDELRYKANEHFPVQLPGDTLQHHKIEKSCHLYK